MIMVFKLDTGPGDTSCIDHYSVDTIQHGGNNLTSGGLTAPILGSFKEPRSSERERGLAALYREAALFRKAFVVINENIVVECL